MGYFNGSKLKQNRKAKKGPRWAKFVKTKTESIQVNLKKLDLLNQLVSD